MTSPGVNKVSCIPSGAWTRALRSPHGAMTGSATRSAPAVDQPLRQLKAVLDLHREPDRAGHPRPASISSTASACALVEQLQRGPPRLEHDHAPAGRTPVGDLLEPQRVAVERHRLVEVLHRQRDPQLRHSTHAPFLTDSPPLARIDQPDDALLESLEADSSREARMAIRPPGKDDLGAIARGYGMHLSDEDLGSFEPMVAGLLSSYDAVEELYAPDRAAAARWADLEAAGPGREPAGRLVRADRDRRSGLTARWPGAGSRSRTTSRSPACR